MMVRICDGRDVVIEAPFIVFENTSKSYPIQGFPENVRDASNRSGLKGWMDKVVFLQYLAEKKSIKIFAAWAETCFVC